MRREAQRERKGYWIPRAALFTGTGILTGAFAYELYHVLGLAQLTPIQLLFLVLSTIAFGWIALGSLSGVLGFLPLFVGENADTIALPPPEGPLKSRTALLFPVYHETPSRIAGTIQAIAFELQSMGRTPAFDVFILSDTRGEADGKAEERAYSALARSLQSIIPVYYRRRRENRGRKSGNIKDWVSRFGGAYEHFVILDGDSVMSGDDARAPGAGDAARREGRPHPDGPAAHRRGDAASVPAAVRLQRVRAVGRHGSCRLAPRPGQLLGP